MVEKSQKLVQQRRDNEKINTIYSCGDPLIESVERVTRIVLIVSNINVHVMHTFPIIICKN